MYDVALSLPKKHKDRSLSGGYRTGWEDVAVWVARPGSHVCTACSAVQYSTVQYSIVLSRMGLILSYFIPLK